MKILSLTTYDPAGASYSLAHALNRFTEHSTLSLRSSDSFAHYPTHMEMRHYNLAVCQKVIKDADILVFHTFISPLFEGLGLTKEMLKGKKVLHYYHGTDLRMYGEALYTETKTLLPEDTQILVSTPDLLLFAPKEANAKWLPVTRSITDLQLKYGRSRLDIAAMKDWDVERVRCVITHAPSDEAKKGSKIIYSAITKLIENRPEIEYQAIQQQPWDCLLRLLSNVDLYIDQIPPFINPYGMIAIEAAAFGIPVFVRLIKEVTDVMKQHGYENPFINFNNEDELIERVLTLALRKDLRRVMGQRVLNYAKKVHDEKPVAMRFCELAGIKP